VKPAFAVNETEIKSYIRNGIVYYGSTFENIISEANLFIDQVKTSDVTPLVTVLLHGPSGAGKTAVAATLAVESGFPFVKVLSADSLVSLSEPSKCAVIQKVNRIFAEFSLIFVAIFGCLQISIELHRSR
jgi:vesicle-fusing ATPase